VNLRYGALGCKVFLKSWGVEMKKILVALLMFPLLAFSYELEIISLQHRSAEDLLPIIRPLLDADEVASGMNYQLILRASPHNLQQIKKLLTRIDIAPRRLKITVMQNVDSETIARLTEVSGTVGNRARVSVPSNGNAAGLNVDLVRGQDRLGAKIISTRALDDSKNTQQVQVLEGNRALVRSGQNVPVPQRQVIQRAWGTQIIDSTQYQEANSGFYVLPRVNGDNVTLEISTQNDSFVPNQATGNYQETRVQRASSTLSGHLGEWLVMGGIGAQKNNDESSISTRSVSAQHEQRDVLIKVDEVGDEN